MRIRVYLDVDGVLAEFDGHCETLFGAGPRSGKLTYQCPRDGLLKGDAALWRHVDAEPRFWLEMPLKPNAHELVDMARPYGVGFLTGCPRTGFDRAVREKRLKLGKEFPGVPVVTCLSRDKASHMQQPGDILVDDMKKNIERWRDAGGTGIFYRSHEQALADLEAALLKQFPHGPV